MLRPFTKPLCTSCCWREATPRLGEIFLHGRSFEAMWASRGGQGSLLASLLPNPDFEVEEG